LGLDRLNLKGCIGCAAIAIGEEAGTAKGAGVTTGEISISKYCQEIVLHFLLKTEVF
jgi:hypothetical protein